MARVSPEANVAFLFLWILFNIHLFYRARGKELYINNGFLIVVVANFCLWFVVHNLVFDQPEKCGGPTAYCGTISCMSGNLYFQGQVNLTHRHRSLSDPRSCCSRYVFMFVVLTSNAYIHLRHIAAGQVEASRDRSKWGSETEVPIFSGCTHGLRAECGLRRDTDKTYDGQDHGISWWFYVAFGIFAGFLSAVIGALVAASMDLDSHTTPLYAFCVGFVLAVCYSTFLGLRRILSWLMPVTYFSSDRVLGDPASTDRVLHPYFSKIDMAERLISFGVVCTTLTAIMPTIATDPRERQHLSDTMSTLHTFGVAIGVTTMAAGACHRTVTFFRLAFPCRPSKVDAPQRRVNCLPCTWVRNSHIIGYPEWVAGVAVDAVIFVTFFTALVSFVYYTSHRESTPTPRSHYCVLYESEDRCHGDGLDLDALGLTPWPCIWSNSSLVHCFNPNCKIEHNQNEVRCWNCCCMCLV